MAVHCGKEWEQRRHERTHVVVVNLDLAGSSIIPKGLPNERELVRAVNDLQNEIEACFKETPEKELWLVGEWSGDGLVALYLDPKPEPEPAVVAAIKIPTIVGDWRTKTATQYNLDAEALRDVDVRIGICSGDIHWNQITNPMTGRVISPFMNEAGHLQKECDPGRVLIDKNTYDYLAELRGSFPDSLKRTVKHGATQLTAYVYQDGPSVKDSPFVGTIEDRIMDALSDCDCVAKAPGACYFFGEFAVMFGHMALIQPIPRYAYVGAKLPGKVKGETKIELEAGYAVKPTFDLYDTNICDRLRFREDFDPVRWEPEELAQINKIARTVLGSKAGTYKLVIYSLIPQKCGLNASSAISIALSGVLIPGQLSQMQHRVLSAADNKPFYGDSGDELSQLIRTAWAFDNVFHGGSSSGCGLTAATMGAPDRWPIIYVAESRGFQGPYPIIFDVLQEQLTDRSWEPLRRIRFVARRAKAIRESSGKAGLRHQFALFYIAEREGKLSTKGIIDLFLGATHVSGEIVEELKTSLASPAGEMHKYYIPTKLIADALVLSEYSITGSFKNRLGQTIPRVSEMLVESLAGALGACALSGISSFTKKGGFQENEWIDFAQCVNAYQEVMCACGVSQPLADLFNYRSDAFSLEFTDGDEKKRLPYGTKLTGAGKGGDFLVLAPKTHLSDNFPTFRHEVRIGRKPLWCHFTSWGEPEEKTEGAQLLRGP